MPISRVRSVTDTSMMFMIPMPPTSRLIAATAASSAVSVRVVPEIVLAISCWSMMLKSSSASRARCRRSRIRRVMSCCAFSVDTELPTESWTCPMSSLPAQPALHRAQRNDDGVVAVLAEVALALRLQQADDAARQRAQAEPAAHRICRSEQLVARRLADDAHRGAGAQLALREPSAAPPASSCRTRNRRWSCR